MNSKCVIEVLNWEDEEVEEGKDGCHPQNHSFNLTTKESRSEQSQKVGVDETDQNPVSSSDQKAIIANVKW